MEFLGGSDITDLTLAHNSGGPKATYHDAELSWNKSYSEYNPLLILFEGLNHIPHLTTLELTFCNLTYPCCFVLEANARSHPTLHTLIIAENPIGWEGMGCIVRLISRHTPLAVVDCKNCRPSTCSYDDVYFHAENPSGDYKLDLRNPFFREFARQCVFWCEEKDIALDGENFKTCRITSDQCAPKTTLDPSDIVKKTQTQQNGVLEMKLRADVTLYGKNNAEMVNAWINTRKICISLTRFVVLAYLWKQCNTAELCVLFLKAFVQVAVIKLSQIKWFSSCGGTLVTPTTIVAILCVSASGNKMHAIEMVPSIAARANLFHEIRNCVLLNPSNPTSHYLLAPSKLIDYDLGERLFVINRWEKRLAANITDTSPLQDRDNISNLLVNSRSRKVAENFVFPRDKNAFISFDYSSPFRVRSDVPTVDPVQLTVLCSLFSASPLNIYSKIFALRGIAHELVLTITDVRSILSLSLKARTMKEIVVACRDCLEDPRVEIMVTVFNRCANRQAMCSPEIIYDPSFFSVKNVNVLCERLHLLKVYDFKNICQRKILCSDKVTSVMGNAGNRHRLYLQRPDNMRLMRFFLLMLEKEDGDNVVDCKYSGASFLKSSSAAIGEMGDFWIPKTWFTEVPAEGIIEFTYVCDEKNVKDNARVDFGHTMGSWAEPPSHSRE